MQINTNYTQRHFSDAVSLFCEPKSASLGLIFFKEDINEVLGIHRIITDNSTPEEREIIVSLNDDKTANLSMYVNDDLIFQLPSIEQTGLIDFVDSVGDSTINFLIYRKSEIFPIPISNYQEGSTMYIMQFQFS